MNYQLNRFVPMALAALLAIGAIGLRANAALAQEPSRDAPLPIRVGTSGKPMLYWSVFGGGPLGFFQKENLLVDFVAFRSDSSMIAATVAGDLDLAIVGLDSTIRAIQGGAKIKVVANGQLNTNSINVAKEIGSIKDLRGKDVAIFSPEEGSTVAFLAMLAAHGMTAKDVHMIAVGTTGDRYAALVAKRVSAAILSQPHDFVGEAAGYKIVARSILDAPPVAGFMVAPSGSGTKNPAVTRFLRAMKATMAWSNDPANKADLIKNWVSFFNVKEEFASKVYDLYVNDAKIWSQGIAPDMGRIKSIADMTEKYTRLKLSTKPSDLVDMSYVDAVEQGK